MSVQLSAAMLITEAPNRSIIDKPVTNFFIGIYCNFVGL